MKIAISALVKGFEHIHQYDMLISRNIHIKNNVLPKLTKYECDVILFHEGNISPHHQQYIVEKSQNLEIKFVDVSSIRKLFSSGYWFMCRFWAYDFMSLLSDYNFVMRIDDDCDILHIDENELHHIFDNDVNYATAAVIGSFVEIGVRREMHRNFLNAYCVKHRIQREKQFDDVIITYPNFMITNIDYYKNYNLATSFLNEIVSDNLTEKIEMGDANIWGIIIDFFDDKGYYTIKNMQYDHKSHHKMIYGDMNSKYGLMIQNWP